MKITTSSFLFSFLFAGLALAQVTPISITGDNPPYGGRLRLPCGTKSCMLDTAGSGSMLSATPENAHLVKVGEHVIGTVQGESTCDVLAPISFELAGKILPGVDFMRCAILPENNSPMLGLNVLKDTRFRFLFSKMEFQWVDNGPALTEPILKLSHWFGFEVTVGDLKVGAVFDTGAPLTLVDEAFVAKNPLMFSPILGETPGGFKVRKVLVPMAIAGKAFQPSTFVMVLDLKAAFGPDAPEIFLGMNQIRNFDWDFDLRQKRFKVEVGPLPE